MREAGDHVPLFLRASRPHADLIGAVRVDDRNALSLDADRVLAVCVRNLYVLRSFVSRERDVIELCAVLRNDSVTHCIVRAKRKKYCADPAEEKQRSDEREVVFLHSRSCLDECFLSQYNKYQMSYPGEAGINSALPSLSIFSALSVPWILRIASAMRPVCLLDRMKNLRSPTDFIFISDSLNSLTEFALPVGEIGLVQREVDGLPVVVVEAQADTHCLADGGQAGAGEHHEHFIFILVCAV